MIESLNPQAMDRKHSNFPYAPESWEESDAERMAREEGVEFGPDQRELVGALQEYFSKHDKPDIHMRELHDALEEKFHRKGGVKYLNKLFPGGPIAQGCRIGGLPVPPGAVDTSFGSVQ